MPWQGRAIQGPGYNPHTRPSPGFGHTGLSPGCLRCACKSITTSKKAHHHTRSCVRVFRCFLWAVPSLPELQPCIPRLTTCVTSTGWPQLIGSIVVRGSLAASEKDAKSPGAARVAKSPGAARVAKSPGAARGAALGALAGAPAPLPLLPRNSLTSSRIVSRPAVMAARAFSVRPAPRAGCHQTQSRRHGCRATCSGRRPGLVAQCCL